MLSLQNKRILLGVTGGIAAYKSAELVRVFQRAGADVRVVMTDAAQEFITPLTMQALSGHTVSTTLLDPEAEAGMGHIELARWADCVVVAPASADFLSRLYQGQGNDLLTTLCLATPSPVIVAPAMNQVMWSNVATQHNIEQLTDRGVRVIGPAEGVQACGDVGLGRMVEPEQIVESVAQYFESGLLAGRRVVITAGPTREAIDPVRYLSNHSSGKMGYALASAATEAGAKVTLISGPTNIDPPERCEFVGVTSAQDMLDASLSNVVDADIFIAAAAVSDYRPEQVSDKKLKKGSQEHLHLTLVKNPDIVATIAAREVKPFTVGFAAETQDVVAYAQEKLHRKNLDMIIANDVSNARIGFNSDNNAVTLLTHSRLLNDKLEPISHTFSERSKSQLARDLMTEIARVFNTIQD